MKSKSNILMATFVIAVMLGTAFAAVCMVNTEDSSAEEYQGVTVTEISIAPGMRYTWTPSYPSSLSVTTTIDLQKQGNLSSGTNVNIASLSGSTLTVNIPQNAASGTVYYVVLKATTSNPTQQLYIPIKFTVGSSLQVQGASTSVVVGSPVSLTPTKTAGMGTITGWALKSGNTLPAGVTLNATTGVVSGTINSAGSYTVTLVATSSYGETAECTISINVADSLILTNSPTNGVIVYAMG